MFSPLPQGYMPLQEMNNLPLKAGSAGISCDHTNPHHPTLKQIYITSWRNVARTLCGCTWEEVKKSDRATLKGDSIVEQIGVSVFAGTSPGWYVASMVLESRVPQNACWA